LTSTLAGPVHGPGPAQRLHRRLGRPRGRAAGERAGPGTVRPRPPGRGSRRRPGLGGGRDRSHHRGRASRGTGEPDRRPGRRAASRSLAPTGSL